MISTVIVTKNDRSRLIRTLDSLLTQSIDENTNWEIVVIDGGDDCLENYISKYNSLPINYFKSVDTGIYDAMNIGIRYSKGEYLHFLNCGDLLNDSSVISATAKEIMLDRLDLYFWNFVFLGNSTVVTIDEVSVLSILDYSKSYCHQAQLIRREILTEFGYSLNYKFVSDYLTTLKILSVGKYRSLKFNGIIYEPGGFSDNHFRDIVSEKRRAFREFVKFRSNIGDSLSGTEIFSGFIWNCNPSLTKVLHRFLR